MRRNMKNDQYRTPFHSATFALGYYWRVLRRLLIMTKNSNSFPEKLYQK